MNWRVLGDWGTSHLRLCRFENGRVTDRRDGPGIGALTSTPTEALRDALSPWMNEGPPTRIDLCGMAGSRNGLQEVAYLDCPAGTEDWV
jgi:2-dehydro-3-deoxygalactonokinase